MDRMKKILLYEMIGGRAGSGPDPVPEIKYSITLTSNVPNAVFESNGLTFVNGVAEPELPGTYSVECYADGYVAQQANISVSEEQPQTSFHFELEEIQPEIEYSITVSSNVPNAVFESNGPTFVNGVAEVNNPGTYTIQCSAPGYITQQLIVVLSEQEPQKSVHFELEESVPEDTPLAPEDFEKSTNVAQTVVDELPDVSNVYYEDLDGPGQDYLESLATPTSPVVRWSMGRLRPGISSWNNGYTLRYEKADYNNKLATIGRTALKNEILENIKIKMKDTLYTRYNCIGAFDEYRKTIWKPIDVERLKDPALNWQNYQSAIPDLDPYYANFGIDISTSVLTRDQIYSYISAIIINQLFPDWITFVDLVGITTDTEFAFDDMIMELEMEGVFDPYRFGSNFDFDETYNNDVVLPIISELQYMEEIDGYEQTAYVFSAKRIEDTTDFQTISSLDDLKTWVNSVFTPEDPAEVLLLGPEFYSTISTDLSEGRKPKIDGLNVENVILQPTGKSLQWVIAKQPPEKGQIAGERIYVGHFDNQGISITPVEIEIEESDRYIDIYANYVVSQWNSYTSGDFAIDRRKTFMYNDPNLSN